MTDQHVIVEPGAVLATIDGGLKLLRDHEVVIRGNLIEAVRPRRKTRDPRHPMRGQLLLPGFISGHTHVAAGTAARGLREGVGLPTRWGHAGSEKALLPMEILEELPDEELDTLTAANLIEILRGGCTTQVEMSSSLRQAQSYSRVAGRLGARGYVAPMVPALNRLTRLWLRSSDAAVQMSESRTLSEIGECVAFAHAIEGTHDDRLRPMLAIALTETHTTQTISAIRTASEELDCPIQLHVQSERAAHLSPSGTRDREIPILDELGLLKRPIFGAHLLSIDAPTDLPTLAQHRFTFVHCPTGGGSGMNPASQPYPEALATGVNTALGLDAHSTDYVEIIKLAVILGRARASLGSSAAKVSMRPGIIDALQSATSSPARGLGRTDLGCVAPGAKADLCGVSLVGPFTGRGVFPPAPLNNLMYANGSCVHTVMTNGIWQVQEGQLVIADEASIRRSRDKLMDALWERLGEAGYLSDVSAVDLGTSGAAETDG